MEMEWIYLAAARKWIPAFVAVMVAAFTAYMMIKGLKRWVECESPTYDKPSVDRMMALAGEDMEALLPGSACCREEYAVVHDHGTGQATSRQFGFPGNALLRVELGC